MKKITLLIFLLAFTTTTFAGRVLTIRNLSNETKYFSALEMQYFSITDARYYTYRSILDYVILEPGEFVTFSDSGSGINGFDFCPTPNSSYTLRKPSIWFAKLLTHPGNIIRWFDYEYNPDPNCFLDPDCSPNIEEQCGDVPPLPATLGNRLEFRGFKILEKDPVSGDINAIDYFVPEFIDGYVHTPHNIKEKYFRMPSPPASGIVELHEIIFQ